MRKQADIAQNVKDFLKSRTVQGAALGGAAGTGLGLLNTKADLKHLLPYITSGTVGGGLLGSAVDSGPSKPSDLESPNRFGQILAGVLGMVAGGALGKRYGGKLFNISDDVARSYGKAIGATTGVGMPYLDDINDLGYYFEE